MNLLDEVLAMPEAELATIIAHMTDEERLALAQVISDRERNPFYAWRHDAVGFVTNALGESTWHKQREILRAIHQHRRVVVAASHSTGKSYIASRAAGAVAVTWPAELVRVQTTATNFRQVKGILWPYINRMHSKYGLPGEVWTTSWKIGSEEVGAGFSASPNNEAAVSGFHAAGELFLVVDEGGGIHPTLGSAFNNILTGTGHALVIGNFPTDSDQTWFNRIWESSEWHQIRISAFDTPNFPQPGGKAFTSMEQVDEWEAQWDRPDDPERLAAFEQVGQCTVCPVSVDPHTIAEHLTDQEWVRSIAAEFGVDSAYYQSRVLALPSTDLVDKTLPMGWLEAVMVDRAEPVKPGPIKLGCDIAADGGDEFVIAQMTGWTAEVVYTRAGAENGNTMNVAAVIMGHIRAARHFHIMHGITEPVRVKVDAIGVGRGVSDRLKELVAELEADEDSPLFTPGSVVIVAVESSRKAHDDQKFKNQRSEMWWTIRELIQPDPTGQVEPVLSIRKEKGQGEQLRLLRQLNAPTWGTAGSGYTVVQLKAEVKRETGHSPDRADALMLAIYEPPVPTGPDTSVGGLFLGKSNPWSRSQAG